MNSDNNPDALEVSLHALIVLGGVFLVYYAYNTIDVFFQALWLNIGSSLVVVTLLFAIFEIFRRRRNSDSHHQQSNSPDPRLPQITSIKTDKQDDEKASAYLDSLRSKQHPPITSNSSKIDRKR